MYPHAALGAVGFLILHVEHPGRVISPNAL